MTDHLDHKARRGSGGGLGHQFSGGVTGKVLAWDDGETDRVSFKTLAEVGGGGSTPFSAVTLEDVVSGRPLYVRRSDGKLGLAQATTLERASCVGFANAAALLGFVAAVDDDLHVEADWTAITGSAALAPGQQYFLGTTPGTLSTVPPSGAGEFVTLVGAALSTTTLEFIRPLPIEL